MAVYACPKCSAGTHVLDVRNYGDGRVYRRRTCDQCKYRFTTAEVFVGDKKPGSRRYQLSRLTRPVDKK